MTSLHTNYRPTTFDDVLGHVATIKSLKKVVKDQRAKTFILTGPSGVGKTTIARILANAFAGGKAAATNIEEFDAASKSGADDVRAVVERTLYRAVGNSPTKTVIVDECHRLSAAAWTILLKPIEEPPAHVFWMLCTTDAAKIPKTIITRCLRYDLKPVSEELILELLVKVADAEKLDIGDDILETIAEGCGGSPRQALVYLEECLYCESVGEARQIMREAGQSKQIIDLCRWIVGSKAKAWVEAVKYVKALEGTDAESARIVIVNYLSAVLVGAKSDQQAAQVLGTLECFKTPYNQSDKLAPLLYSLGLHLGLDR